MNDLVERLREIGGTRLKSEPTDDPKHYLNVIAKLSVSDGKLIVEAASRIEALERQVKAADALAEAVDDFGNLKPTDSSVVWGLRLSRCLSELAAYNAAKEGGA